jgi:hypothetical protein
MDFWNPMFVLSEGFARAHGLHDRRPKTQTEAVENVEIDMSKIAQMTTDALGEVVGREIVENALLDIVDRIGEACADQAVGVVTLDFKFGKLLCENKSLEFIFGSPGTASQAARQPNAKPPSTANSNRGGGRPPPSRGGSEGGRSVKSDATSLDLTVSSIARRKTDAPMQRPHRAHVKRAVKVHPPRDAPPPHGPAPTVSPTPSRQPPLLSRTSSPIPSRIPSLSPPPSSQPERSPRLSPTPPPLANLNPRPALHPSPDPSPTTRPSPLTR